MRGKAAVNRNAKVPRRRADVLVADFAGGALAAADPRVDGDLAPGLDFRIRPGTFDCPGDLVPEREWQGAALPHVELFAVAEQKIAILHMQVGMADAAAGDTHQHFTALRPRGLDHRFTQRRSISGERLTVHLHGADFTRAPSPAQRKHSPAPRSPRPESLQPAPSARCMPRQATSAYRRRPISGFGAAFCGAGRTPPRLPAAARSHRRQAAWRAGSAAPPTRSPSAAVRRQWAPHRT